MSEEKLKHLDYLQQNIERMNRCSFKAKACCITIVSAIFALSAAMIPNGGDQAPPIMFTALLPIIIIYLLDTFYLMKERNLITTYNIVAGILESEAIIKPFEIMPDLGEDKTSYWKAFFSISELLVYGGLLLLVIAIFIIC